MTKDPRFDDRARRLALSAVTPSRVKFYGTLWLVRAAGWKADATRGLNAAQVQSAIRGICNSRRRRESGVLS